MYSYNSSPLSCFWNKVNPLLTHSESIIKPAPVVMPEVISIPDPIDDNSNGVDSEYSRYLSRKLLTNILFPS